MCRAQVLAGLSLRYFGHTTSPMKTIVAIGLLAIAPALHAQVDMNAILQQQGLNMRMEDDNDPFVPNTFTGSFRMETHVFENGTEKKESPMNVRYWSSPELSMVQMAMPGQPGEGMKILTDHKGKWQYMLMADADGKRMAMKSKKKKMVMTGQAQDAPNPDIKVTVTKETKTIDGHVCTKVIGTSTKGTWTGWVAMKLTSPMKDIAKSMTTGDQDVAKEIGKLNGFPLEYEWVSADGKERLVCNVRELSTAAVEPVTFSLDGYEVVVIPGM